MFLKCPLVRYVSYEPKQLNYQFPTEGVIHEKTILELMDVIEKEDFGAVKSKISTLFSHHRLGQILPFLEIDELGDYLRHLVICNHDSLDWSYIDYCIAVIDKKFPSRWKIPKLEIDLAFRSLFSSFILLQPNETERFLLRDLLLLLPENEIHQRHLLEKLIDPQLKIKHFSFASLISLYNRFIRKIYVEEKDNFHLKNKFSILNEFFEVQFEKIYQKFKDQKMVSAAISIIHSYLIIEQGLEPFEAVISRFETNVKAIKTLSKHEQDLLGLILGASYSKLLANRYFRTLPIEEFTSILLKTKRLLIPSDNIKGLLHEFREAILTYRIHPMLVYIISEGLSSILYHFAMLDRKFGGQIKEIATIFRETLDFRYEMTDIVNLALEERAWLKDSLSFDYLEFIQLQKWDTLYYVFHWPDEETTKKRLNELITFLKDTNPHLIKFVNFYVELITGRYQSQVIEKLHTKKKEDNEGLFYEETEKGLLEVLAYLINLQSPNFPSLNVIHKNELMIDLIKSWLLAFERLNLAHTDLFEFLAPIVLEIQAQRIEHDYLEGNPTLALIHSMNFFLFDLWKKKQQKEHLTLGSENENSQSEYVKMFRKIMSTFESRQNTKRIVQRLTADLTNILKTTLFNKVSTRSSLRSLIEMEKYLISSSQKRTDQEIDFSKLNYFLGNIVVALGTFFSALERNLSGEIDWDRLVKGIEDLRKVMPTLKNSNFSSPSHLDLFLFPLCQEHSLAEALHIFPMIVEVPKLFFKI